MKPYTTASCFATYLLPHILFMPGFAERQQVVRICCLAWNIALFPDARTRNQHLKATLRLLLDDPKNPAPPHVRKGFGDEVRMLVGIKRDLFPWVSDTITDADLKQTPGVDVLSVSTVTRVERIDLPCNPPLAALPSVSKVLAQAHTATKAQRATLEEAARTPGLIAQAVGWDMVAAYCAQRADLRGYHKMLTTWSEASGDPELVTAVEPFLAAVSEIEANTKAVLAILVPHLRC